jgi:hypothetical protein
MLQFDPAWRFESPGTAEDTLADEVIQNIIFRIATTSSRKEVLEVFKRHYAKNTGEPYYSSSSESWAYSDLLELMRRLASQNTALFCESLYDGLVEITSQQPHVAIPPWPYVNKYLAATGFAIDPPVLMVADNFLPISVPKKVTSLSEKANDVIQKSLMESENFLAAGKNRAAVQSILWLLETVSTSFRGVEFQDGDVTGKYFSKIVGDLRRYNRGKALDRISMWLENIYGFLSAPDGGGIRHGAVLRDHEEVTAAEARLYCDLIRSFITFLLQEHTRFISGRP